MTALAILGIVGLLLLAPLVVAALRQRTLFSMALRNIGRRRAEAILVVAGLLGTGIITCRSSSVTSSKPPSPTWRGPGTALSTSR